MKTLCCVCGKNPREWPESGKNYRCRPCQQEYDREKQREYRERYHLAVVERLGGKCARCGYDEDKRILQIDHLNGGGTQERLVIHSLGIARKIMRGETEGYILLCPNCNWIKRYDLREFGSGGKRKSHAS